MSQKVRNLVEDYLKETILMQLATASGGHPWVCTVHYAYDDDWNFYWLSMPTSRHSEELTKSPQMAGAIVRAHQIAEPPQGLQFEGTALPATGSEVDQGKAVYRQRFGFDSSEGHELYIAKPHRLVWFDAVNFAKDPQQEIKL